MSTSAGEELLATLLGPDTPGVRLIAVSSLHGSATVDGTSEVMGNATDAALFGALRAWAEVAVVGSATVEAEGYFAPAPGHARLAVLSSSLSFDPGTDFFSAHPLVLCPDSRVDSPEARAMEDRGAEVRGVGKGSVPEVIEALRGAGYRRISCEGGPSVYSAFIAAGAVDTFYLTLDPHLAAAVEHPVVGAADQDSAEIPESLQMTLENVTAVGSTVFLRYARTPAP
ncbi:dihydrofolate reductase family protein [Corynebacterium sp.]|uniref:dihydrofolate reductase family protein n=1 Tax=Corynebacterium sp. TaxID=1720 RepID=UPI0026DCB87F|nr:dihydrofolate reductase family protein [Corynebacterium sp.]MDO5031729.1 dihydrofolate reductase family protein [Corynebacterium sp.]